MADLFLGRPRSRRYPKFNIRRDIPLIDRFGLDVIRQATQDIFDVTEANYREFISSIPDGVYEEGVYADSCG